MNRFFLIVFFLAHWLVMRAQIDSIQASISSEVAAGSAGYLPFHIGHNQFGKFDPNNQDGQLMASVFLPIYANNGFKINAGADYVLKPRLDQSFLHQGYLNISWKELSLRVGKNEINNWSYNDQLGSGSMFQSQNARTIPKIGFGIWEYTPLPFLKWIEVAGSFEVGKLETDRPIKDIFFHEKSAYLKISQFPIRPFVGISHSVMFGGTTSSGTKLPANFIDAAFARSAPYSGNASDSVNATGAHFGIFDMGVELPFDENALTVSFQQPISDASGYQTNFTKNNDHVIIFDLKLSGNGVIKNILYENINTVHQSGPGLTDPYIHGIFYSNAQLNALDDYDAFVLQQYGITTNNLTWPEFRDLVKDQSNFGYAYGGRDDYYNNDQFPLGNTHEKMVIGNPLFMTHDRFTTLTGETTSDSKFVINNRINAHHFGIGGNFKDFEFTVRGTISQNWGTYTGKYSGFRASWVLDQWYYFRDVITTQYVSIEVKKETKNGIRYRVMVAGDAAEFGNNFGMLLGAKYRLR